MIREIKMPRAGQTTDEALIGSVLVQVGDEIKRGTPLFEVETDKATLPVESYLAGTVLSILVSEGDRVKEGTVLVAVGEKGERYAGGSPDNTQEVTAAPPTQPEMEADTQTVAESTTAADPNDDYIPIVRGQAPAARREKAGAETPKAVSREPLPDYPAMPGAKMLAREKRVDIRLVPAANGVYVKRSDVLAYDGEAGQKDAVSGDEEEYSVEKMSRMRQIIARRMLESKQTIPDWQCTVTVNMDGCIALQKAYKDRYDVKLSYNAMIAKAIAIAAREFPRINARYEEDAIKISRHSNIGLAVGLDDALLVPVLRNVEAMDLCEITAGYQELIQKAKKGRLSPDDMGCGSITISNLGMYAVDDFVAVVNPPESAILAVSRIQIEPVWNGSTFIPVSRMKITGSFDHKFIDGMYGAKFMTELKALLETPALLCGREDKA